MIPASPGVDNPSAAEVRIFRRLARETPNEWIALHSLGLSNHDQKPWAEIDFVVICPAGLFCLEVKGGRIARSGGVWQFTDRNGKTTDKRQGPFEQVGSATAALYRYIRSQAPQLGDIVCGYGVLTPDVAFDIRGPDIVPELVWDLNSLDQPLSAYMSRVTAYWQTRLGRACVVSPAGVADILEILRPDFDLKPTLRTLARAAETEFIRLTQQQCAVMDGLIDNERALIRGGAGTGKSLLAVYEARRLASLGKRVLLCCFNKLLAAELSTTVPKAKVTVQHFHGFMATVAGRNRLSQVRDVPTDRLLRHVLPKIAIDALQETHHEPFDALVVDEGQDLLTSEYVQVFSQLLRGGVDHGVWRIFLDPQQDLFRALDDNVVRRLTSVGSTQYRLSQNCRNTAPIGLTTAILASSGLGEMCSVDGPQVRQIWYTSDEEQIRQLSLEVQLLLGEGLSPDQIILLAEKRLEATTLGRLPGRFPYRLNDLSEPVARRPGGIRFSTVHAFKGLESDVVLLFDVDDLSAGHIGKLLYVGASRAKFLLVMSMHERTRQREFSVRVRESSRDSW